MIKKSELINLRLSFILPWWSISQIQVSQIGSGGGGKYSVVSLHWLKETPEKQPDESFEKIYLSTRLFIESLQDD